MQKALASTSNIIEEIANLNSNIHTNDLARQHDHRTVIDDQFALTGGISSAFGAQSNTNYELESLGYQASS